MQRLFYSLALLLVSTSSCTAQTWYKANDPFGGQVFQLTKADDGNLLCGTGRGLYSSSDNGESWEDISGEYGYLPVSDVQTTPTGMYIAVFNPYLRRSFDSGQTWETIPAQGWSSLNKIIVNETGQIFVNTNTSVWRSADNGDTWTQLTIASNVNSVSGLELSPDGELFVGSYNSKIYRSGDNGDTWVELFVAAGDVRTFAFDGDDVIYGGTSYSGVYKSVDNGVNWTLLPALPGTNGALDIAINAAGEVFATPLDKGLLRSSDGGMSWVDITSDLIDPAVRKVFLNSNDELFVGTVSAGVQQRVGSSWTARNQGITAIYIERFTSADGVFYACTGSGVFISEDGGLTWQQSLLGMDDTEILTLAKAPNGDLYAGGEMLYRSVDGVNWTLISQAFVDGEIHATDLLVEPDGRVIVATDEYGIRFSDDQGQSWISANGGLEDVTMAFIRQNATGTFFTADGYNLYRSNDLTGNWEIINTGLSDTDITGFAVSDGALFAITYSDGLFRSMDNGDNWTLVQEEDFNNVAVNGSELYGSSESIAFGGVYFSGNNGATWSNIGDGLPNMQILEVTYVDGLGLFANVREHGLYSLDFSVVGFNEAVAEEGRLTCFPNPFSGSTTLRLVLEKAAPVSVMLSTVEGRIIRRSAPVDLSKGGHDLQVGEDLQPGAYVLTVFIGNASRTIPLVRSDR